MFTNNFFAKIFFLIICGISIYAMEEKSLPSSSENKEDSAVFSANTNQDNEIPELRKIAFFKVNQILNNLTLQDEPEWILKFLCPEEDGLKKVPFEIEDAIKQELIKRNGATWWYCFGDIAQINDLNYNFENPSPSFTIIILSENNRLVFLDFPEKNVVIKVFSLEPFELTHHAQIDVETVIKSNDENIDLEIELHCLKNEKANIKLKVSELKNYCFAAEESSKILNIGYCYFLSLDLKDYSWFEFAINKDDGLSKFCIPVIGASETLDLDKFQNFLSETVTGTMPQILRGFYTSDDCRFMPVNLKVKLSSNKKYVVALANEHALKIWNLETLECIATIELPHPIKNLQLSKDNTFMLIQGSDILEILDMDSVKKIHAVNNVQNIQAVSMSKDNTILAILSSSENDNKIIIVSLSNLLNDLTIVQITLIKLLYAQYKISGYTEIYSNSIWNQILKSFNSDIQQLIFEKFNLRISAT